MEAKYADTAEIKLHLKYKVHKMTGQTNLNVLLKTMKPVHNTGDYVFCTLSSLTGINPDEMLMLFKEQEGYTIITSREMATTLQLPYSFVAAWITLTVHSSLEAVGLTAAFSAALAKEGISCNVVAAYYHDHIFVDKKDAAKAMAVLNSFAA
jgi:uncharacterized protein